VENAAYDFAVKRITDVLNAAVADKVRRYPRSTDGATPYDHAHGVVRANLEPAGVDFGGLAIRNRRVEPEHHGELVQALADLVGAGVGSIKPDDVMLVLGEAGGIWSARIRPSPLEAAQEAVAEVRGMLKSIARNLALMHRGAILTPGHGTLTLDDIGMAIESPQALRKG